MLESMPRSAAYKPNVFNFRMTVDQKIPIPRILVLTNPRLHNRCPAQCREALLNETPRLLRAFRARQARLRIWIDALAVPVHCNLQSPALQVRHPVNLILLKQPRWQRWRRKPRIARRRAKEKHLLPGGENSLPQNLREKFREPSSASKDKYISLNALAGISRHRRNRFRASRLGNLRHAILHANALCILSHG